MRAIFSAALALALFHNSCSATEDIVSVAKLPKTQRLVKQLMHAALASWNAFESYRQITAGSLAVRSRASPGGGEQSGYSRWTSPECARGILPSSTGRARRSHWVDSMLPVVNGANVQSLHFWRSLTVVVVTGDEDTSWALIWILAGRSQGRWYIAIEDGGETCKPSVTTAKWWQIELVACCTKFDCLDDIKPVYEASPSQHSIHFPWPQAARQLYLEAEKMYKPVEASSASSCPVFSSSTARQEPKKKKVDAKNGDDPEA
jgi:hypothetical protein